MAGRVFDDNGGVWSSTSTEFSMTFATHGSGLSSGDYAVKALGFVVVDIFGHTAQFRLSPAIVSSNALMQAFDWLKGQRYERISIAYCGDVWSYGFARTLDAAAGHIADTIGRTARASLDRVIRRRTDRSDIHRSPVLASLMREWREVVGSGALVDPVHFAHRHLQQRFVVAASRTGSDALVFDAIGSGFRYYGDTWVASSLGKPLSAQPDPVYGAWVTESYQEARHLGEPTVHDVDAVIKPSPGGMARLRIRRVVVPLPAPRGQSLVIGGSFYDDSVDLRRVADAAANEGAISDLTLRLKVAHHKINNLHAP